MLLQKKIVVKKPVVMKPKVDVDDFEIEVSEGKPDIYHTTWIIFGPPGVGKTTLFSGFEDVLFLVTSKKELQVVSVPNLLIESWEKLERVTDSLIQKRNTKYAQYKFIAIDFLDIIWTYAIAAVNKKYGIQHYTDAQYGKGAHTLDSFMRGWLTQLIASDYGILMVSHVTQRNIIQPGGQITKTITTLPDRACSVIFPLVNVIGCMDYKTIKEENPAQPGKILLRRKRVIQFEGTDYIEAKDRDGILPSELILVKDPEVNFRVFKEYYDGVRVKK